MQPVRQDPSPQEPSLARDRMRGFALARLWKGVAGAWQILPRFPPRGSMTNAAVLDEALARARGAAACRMPSEPPDRLDAADEAHRARSVAAGREEVARAREKEAGRLDLQYPRTDADPVPPGLACSARLP